MSIRRIAAVLAAAAATRVVVVGSSTTTMAAGPVSHGAPATAAPALPSPASPASHAHLKVDTIMIDAWDSPAVWGHEGDPQLPDGGVLFLYDPDQKQVPDGFGVPGDPREGLFTTTDWKKVMFDDYSFRRGRSRVEVR